MKQEKKVVVKQKKTVTLTYWRCNPNDKMDGTVKLWDSNGWYGSFWFLPKSQAVKHYKWFMGFIHKPVPKRVHLEIE